jgi:aldose 1-epimerase
VSVTTEAFGKNKYNETVQLFTLSNDAGMVVRIMDHGGTIVSIETPDKNGVLADVVMAHDAAADYGDETPYFGSVIGRFANRIKEGRFRLDGVEYSLATNNGPNALHGGLRGFDKVIWESRIVEDENALRLSYISVDGEEGFPGELTTVMTYTLTEENELKIDYHAQTTQATPLNLTNHSYFNLAGHDSGDIGKHVITIRADSYLPTDATAIPYGEAASVSGTPFDFLRPHAIGERIDEPNEQLQFAGGYDHNYCINKETADELRFAARAEDPESGRVMEVYTTEPGVQLYTGNFLDGTVVGKGGCHYVRRGGFCLETQHYPDSPNQENFPNTILRPGESFISQTIYRFSTTGR